MAEIIKVDDTNFDELVLNSAKPVLVDFYGTWCTPCQQVKPVLEEIAEEFADKLTVAEAEVSETPEAAGKFDVMGVPTLLLVIGGEAKDTLTGGLTKASILDAITPHLS